MPNNKGQSMRKKNAACNTIDSSTEQVCPITQERMHELSDEIAFNVCNDTAIYNVKALGDWVFFKKEWDEPSFPHNNVVIPYDTLQRLYASYYAVSDQQTRKRLEGVRNKFFDTDGLDGNPVFQTLSEDERDWFRSVQSQTPIEDVWELHRLRNNTLHGVNIMQSLRKLVKWLVDPYSSRPIPENEESRAAISTTTARDQLIEQIQQQHTWLHRNMEAFEIVVFVPHDTFKPAIAILLSNKAVVILLEPDAQFSVFKDLQRVGDSQVLRALEDLEPFTILAHVRHVDRTQNSLKVLLDYHLSMDAEMDWIRQFATQPIATYQGLLQLQQAKYHQTPVVPIVKSMIEWVYDNVGQINGPWKDDPYKKDIKIGTTIQQLIIIACLEAVNPYIQVQLKVTAEQPKGTQSWIKDVRLICIYMPSHSKAPIQGHVVDTNERVGYVSSIIRLADITMPIEKTLLLGILQSGGTQVGYYKYNGHKYKIRTGKMGGKYILCRGNKIYIKK